MKSKKQKTKKIKEIKLPVKFNPGTQKYEPILPLRKTNKKLEIKTNWKWIIILVISVIIVVGGILLALKYGLLS